MNSSNKTNIFICQVRNHITDLAYKFNIVPFKIALSTILNNKRTKLKSCTTNLLENEKIPKKKTYKLCLIYYILFFKFLLTSPLRLSELSMSRSKAIDVKLLHFFQEH
ncbi:hypothetical protein BpHYR1_010303 [Brachionus plicatilis]|uniref:Uncharacterized protein n=1 Tax=Brachionus plicatilis TaxID=10195 RepID=A0A3M7PWI4_BRAPC|nr:hypothetical protein BpHYR1_010303 [Brachionus plicatilis]